MKKIICVDVDLTVVDTMNPWFKWFQEQLGKEVAIPNESGAYDLVPEMKRIATENGHPDLDPFDYWKLSDLYDNLEPLPGSVEKLTAYGDAGWQIVFASLCVPEHEKSKLRFLDKHFTYDAFISTGSKEYIQYDVMIDDREKHYLDGESLNPNATHYLFTQVERNRNIDVSDYRQLAHWDHLAVG